MSVLFVTLWLGLREQNRRIHAVHQQLDRLEQLVNIHDRDMTNQQLGLLQSQLRQLQRRFDTNDRSLQELIEAERATLSPKTKTRQDPEPIVDTDSIQDVKGQPGAEGPSVIPSPHRLKRSEE
jgi:hypothetical protein